MNPEEKARHEALIERVTNENPEAFINPTVIENGEFLRPFGIFIPGKDDFPQGVIKHFPEDFIVEEIQNDGKVTDISYKEPNDVKGTGQFVHATLVKCGASTLEAIEDMAKALKCQKTDIGYSGIKDKEAITAQRISIRNVPIQAILSLRAPNFFLKDLKASNEPIKKGVIAGNKFTIYVRTSPDLFEDEKTQQFLQRLENIKSEGFYNFYYLQRFGMPRLANISVGLHIMRGEYDKAIKDIITRPSHLENPFMAGIRKKLAQSYGDWNKCKEIIGDALFFFRDETTLINFLLKKPNHWEGALQQMLDKVSINVYSIPSLFFNEYISMRLESGMEVPRELPLLLSDDRRDIDMYRDMLQGIGLYPFTGKYLKFFSIIRFMKRSVPTKDIPELHSASVTDEGVVISFSLGKGQYATTFLSHLFNLVSGKAPDFVSDNHIDTRKSLGTDDLVDTLDYFKDILNSKQKLRDLGAGASE